MSLLESLAKYLGKNKDSFKAISIINVVSTFTLLLYFVGIIIYYTTPVDHQDCSVNKARKVQSSPGIELYLVILCVFIAFPLTQLISVASSIIWVVHNFDRERKVLRKISMFGTVFQVLIGLVLIAFAIFLIIIAPILHIVPIITVSLACVLEVWWVFAALCSFAQNKRMIMEEELKRRARISEEDQEQLIEQ